MTDSAPNRLLAARRRFFDEGAAPRGLVPATILRSWQRCAGLGLSESARPDVAPMTQQRLREACQKHEELRRVCMPEMNALYADARATGSIVILTAPDGLILEALGSADFLDKASRVALRPGVPWSENTTGTNAIGTAMIEGGAVEVRGSEHFFAPHRVLSCSAVPIIDPFGKMAGVMDLSGEASVHHVHALGMVRMAVDQIEHRLFERDFPGCRVLRLHRDAGMLGTVHEGILVFEGNRLCAANRHGLAQLQLVRGDIGRRGFEELFEAKLGEADRSGMLRDSHGKALTVRSSHAESIPGSSSRKASQNKAIHRSVVEPYFDARLEYEFDRACRVLGAGMPVMLRGETGTGKEVFARELHRRFAKKGAPFVAVNCAGLPENLIEAELFGYEEGAFTGARRSGARGLMRAADGGVLFLDEIGDMPLSLQSRLLRALQEREVTPLGASIAVKVDFALISATHRDLEQAIALGNFRSDLYFRIAHYALRLPPLREHADLRGLIKRLLAHAATTHRVRLDDDALDALVGYEWPGNFRQLSGTLITLIALAGDDGEVRCRDLPPAVLAHLLKSPPAIVADAIDSGPITSTRHSQQRRLGAAPTLAGITGQAIREAIDAHAGNIAAAARQLGISRSTLYRRLQ